jgi:phage tail sheath protein FI
MPEQYLHGVQVIEVTDGPRPIRTVNSAVIGLVGTAPGAEAAVAASAILGTGTSALTITADTAGIAGNAISIRLRNPGAASQSLSVSLTDKAITVNLATDNAGVVTSTPALIKTALDANAGIAALVSVASGGSGVVSPTSTVLLSGGKDEAFPLNTPYLVAGSVTEAARAGTTGTIPAALADIFAQAGAVVVVIRGKTVEMGLNADAGGHGKTADIIRLATLYRRDKVRQSIVGLPGRFDGLLTEVMQDGEGLCARVICVEVDVVALACGGEKADHGSGR